MRTTLLQDLGGARTIRSALDLLVPDADLGVSDGEERYETKTTLGEGGMGEVLLCRDRRIGREVAMKVVHRNRAAGGDLHPRFVREARVQGQLEHPAIVPVYDLAKDATGRSFFTMKRVRGQTLEGVISRLADGDAQINAEYTRHKLLSAYARVCLAIDFAHARGVVHCDLKPANVMFGDFGEVYVLDWGVAKIDETGADVDVTGPLEESGERIALHDAAVSSQTAAGVILGTPAYMAPEQLRGRAVDARTDVFALGAILFELLTLRSLHQAGGEAAQALDGLPPELVVICERATATAPSQRYATARELHDAVESFLSGDRDLATRKVLVEGHLAAAQALRAAPSESTEGRSRALAEVGRAIALDPNHFEALRLLVELLSEPPKVVPPEVLEELELADERSRLGGLKRGVALYTLPVLCFFLPAALIMGVKSITAVAVCFASFLVAGAVSALAYKIPSVTRHVPWVTVASSLAMTTTAVLSGIYVLLPTFVVANTICHAVTGRRRHRPMIIALGVVSLVVPVVLELTGLVHSSHAIVRGAFVITSRAVTMSEPLTPIFLVLANVGLVVFTARFIVHYRDSLSRSEQQHLSQLWQLRQLVPEGARSATSVRPKKAV